MDKKSEIKYQGKMFEIVTFKAKPGYFYETAVRAPGVRLLIEYKKDTQFGLLMTRELRHDRDRSTLDYRLPGGKVFDSLEEYNKAKDNHVDIAAQAFKQAKVEARQEVGVIDGDFTPIAIARAGGSVEWDLHYFLVKNSTLGEQDLTEEEKVDNIEVVFLTVKEIFDKLKNKEINEGRSADVIWRWLADNNFVQFI
jgi:hypothetical protein